MSGQNNANKKPNKRVLLKAALLSISLMSTVFVFAPLEMYFLYKSEFIVGTGVILLPMLFIAAAAALLNTLYIALIHRLSKKFYIFTVLFQLGLLLAFYIQMLLFNGSMMLVGNDQTVYLDDTALIAGNTAAYFVILIFPAFLYLLSVHYKDNGPLCAAVRNMTVFVSAAVFFMQLAGLASSAANASRIKHPLDYDRYLSYAPTAELSKDGNIIVFVVDRLEGAWFEKFIGDRPELIDTFDGFTYYANNLSNYVTTFPSIINFLTHAEYAYDGDPISFIYDAWSGDTLIDDLKAAGYEADMLVSRDSTYYDIENIANRCGNIFPCGDMLEIKYGTIARTMTDMALGKVMPYLLKPLFLNKYDSSFTVDFLRYSNMPDDYMIKKVSSENDVRFYNYIKKYGLNADAGQKKFVFIHLNGVHDKSREVSMIDPKFDPNIQVDTESTAMGVFEIIGQYFADMKRLGVYDNSTIIVMADHGRPAYELIDDNNTLISAPIMTTLLVKPAGAQRGPLTADSQSELSNINFAASVLEYAGVDTDKYGDSYNDIIKSGKHWERTVQTDNSKDGTHIRKCAKYSVTGNARDFANWHVISE